MPYFNHKDVICTYEFGMLLSDLSVGNNFDPVLYTKDTTTSPEKVLGPLQ